MLMGRRSSRVAGYPGQWEFAPSGAVEPGADPAETITRELCEETGLRAIAPPTPIAVIRDEVLRCWELVYRLAIDEGSRPIATDEYPEVNWFEIGQLPAPLSPMAERLSALLGDQVLGGAQRD